MTENKGKFTSKFANKTQENSVENQDQQDLILKLEAEKAEMKDSMIRALAEAENIKKRLTLEKTEAIKYALSKPISDIAVLIDNFDLSIKSVSQDDLQGAHFKAFFDAISTNVANFIKALEKYGVRRINPIGEKFNPKEHEAVSQIPAQEGQESGVVVQVLSAGYAIEERVIKPSIVIVSA